MGEWHCPSDYKRCGTCEFWAGQRKLDMPFCHYSIVEPGSHGQCVNSKSGWFRQNMQECHNCSQYQKWGTLK
jgi:hypothetical protein